MNSSQAITSEEFRSVFNSHFQGEEIVDFKVRNLRVGKSLSNKNTFLLESETDFSAAKISILNQSGLYQYVEKTETAFALTTNTQACIEPNDSEFYKQWTLLNRGISNDFFSSAGADIKMCEAWDIEKGSSDIIIGFMDSGVNMAHAELRNRIWQNPNEIPGNGIDDDQNGYVDDFSGWDFENNDANPTDDYFHGTACAGIVLANPDNDLGYSGMDWRCKGMITKVLGSNGTGTSANIAEGIYYLVDNGSDVINVSLAVNRSPDVVREALDYAAEKEVVIVVAIGNSNSSQTIFPSTHPHVIAVGSSDPTDVRSRQFLGGNEGSSFGSHLSVLAPGNFVYVLEHKSPFTYDNFRGGTSMAAPHVSGLAGLLLAQNPNLTPAEVKNLIEMSADDKIGDPSEDEEGWDQYYGHGRINALKALTMGLSSKTKNRIGSENLISAYPNPGREIFIDYKKVEGKLLAAEVYDLAGKLVQSYKTPKMNGSFTISNLHSGTFVVKLLTEQFTYQKLIIVQ